MPVERYVVAVKREKRDEAPADWVEQLSAIKGVRVTGSSERRGQIEASDAAVTRLKSALGSWLHIEPVVEHFPLAPPKRTGHEKGA